MEKIAIVGTGGFAREILSLINDINNKTPTFDIIGFVDSDKSIHLHGYSVIGNDDEINKTKEPLSLVIAVGEPHLKERIRTKFTNPLVKFPTLIHPSVLIGDHESVKLGKGCIICAGTILTTDIQIMDFVTLNLMCTIGHDSIVGNYTSMMPSVNVSGEVIVHDKVYVGTGAKIINQIEIGEQTIIGAGAIVTNSIPAHCTAVGVPAKPIKYHH